MEKIKISVSSLISREHEGKWRERAKGKGQTESERGKKREITQVEAVLITFPPTSGR
jgi:hypothetical protein